MRRLLCLLLIIAAVPLSAAEAKKAPKPQPGTDEFAIQSTVLAVYDVISGPAGPRDWDHFKELFTAGAHLASYRNNKATVFTPDDYIARAKPYMEQNGFFERPVETKIDRFKDIAHVTSRYESRHAADDEKPFARGVNHFELVRSGDRWQVLSIVWQEE